MWLEIAIACASLLISFCAAELALRATRLVNIPPGIPATAGYSSFYDRAEGRFYHRTNQLGFRTRDFDLDQIGARPMLAIIGDSHTFGVGVNDQERFSDLLQSRLDQIGKDHLVLNLGSPGASFRRYAKTVDAISKWNPSVYVIVLYSGNDVYEGIEESKFEWNHDEALAVSGALSALRRLHFYHLMRQAVSAQKTDENWGQSPCQIRANIEWHGAFAQQLQQTCALSSFDQGDWVVRNRSNMSSLLERLKQLSTPKIVFVLPSKLLAEAGRAERTSTETLRQLNIPQKQAIALSGEVHASLVREAKEALSCPDDTPCVHDLLPALSDHPEVEKYFPRDWHLNPAGHAIVANALFNVLNRFPRVSQ